MGGIDWGHLLWEFDGRINRAKWWTVILVTSFVVTLVWSLFLVLDPSPWLWAIATLVTLFAIWPALAGHVKRFHDRNKSGWWVLIGFVPLIGSIWLLVELGFLSGSPGENDFGPDPLASS